MSAKYYILIVVIFAAIIAGAVYFSRTGGNQAVTSPAERGVSQTQTSTPASNQTSTPSTGGAVPKQSVVVTYTDSGYSPNTVNIKAGTTVTWRDQSSEGMWTASDVHPAHTLYDETSLKEHCTNPTSNTFDECRTVQPGSSWSFDFNKIGTWKYHNHVDPGMVGTVIVTK